GRQSVHCRTKRRKATWAQVKPPLRVGRGRGDGNNGLVKVRYEGKLAIVDRADGCGTLLSALSAVTNVSEKIELNCPHCHHPLRAERAAKENEAAQTLAAISQERDQLRQELQTLKEDRAAIQTQSEEAIRLGAELEGLRAEQGIRQAESEQLREAAAREQER